MWTRHQFWFFAISSAALAAWTSFLAVMAALTLLGI